MAADTRLGLLEAAKAEFLGKGWAATTGLGIRTRANVSQGSWAHFFPGGKEQVAEEIYDAVHQSLWSESIAALNIGVGSSAHPSLLRALTSFLSKVESEPDEWRLLFQLEEGLMQKGLKTVPRSSQRKQRLLVEVWARQRQPGLLEPLPGSLIYALVFGPALMAARLWLAGADCGGLTKWAKPLAEKARAAVFKPEIIEPPIRATTRRKHNADVARGAGNQTARAESDQSGSYPAAVK